MSYVCSTKERKNTYNIPVKNTEEITCTSLDRQKDNIKIDYKETG